MYGWPVYLNGTAYQLMWNDYLSSTVSGVLAIVSLITALILSAKNKGKSFCILACLFYTSCKSYWIIVNNIYLLKNHPIHLVVSDQKENYGLLLGYAACSFAAIFYLWRYKNYKELFAFRKIVFFQKLTHSYAASLTRQFTKITGWLLGKSPAKLLKMTWRYREWVLVLGFILGMYFFWFKQYTPFPWNAKFSYYIIYLKALLVPGGILLGSLIAYAVHLFNKPGVILSTVAPITSGCYGLYHYYYYLIQFWNSTPLVQKDLMKVYYKLEQFMGIPASFTFIPDFLTMSIGVFVMVRMFKTPARTEKADKPMSCSTNYGSAQFLDYKGIKKLNHPEGIPIGAMPKNTNFSDPLAIAESIKKTTGDDLIRIKAQHVTLIAPSRSGKGIGIIIPTLLDYSGPVFVTDIKGENYCVTKKARMNKGRKVYAFDPFGISGDVGIRIDLLEFLDPDSQEVANQAQALANILCPISPTDMAETRHFKNQCQAVIECLSLFVLFSTEYENRRNLRSVHDIICSAKNEFENTFKTISEHTDLAGGTISNIANRVLSIAEKERSSVFTTTHNCVKFLNSPKIAEATSHIGKCQAVLFLLENSEEPKSIEANTILLRKTNGNVIAYWKEHSNNIVKILTDDVVNALYQALPECKDNWQSKLINFVDDEALVEELVSICGYGASDIKVSSILNGDIDLFICIPPQYLSAQENLLRLIFGMVVNIMQQKNKKEGKNIRLLMLLDEMPSLGYLPQIEQILSHGAGYGMHLMIISQTIGLLRGVYRQATDTFLTNDLCLYFGCADNETSQLVSSLLGKTTIEVGSSNEGTSTQRSSEQSAKGSSYNISDSVSETARDLLMSNEIRMLGNQAVIAFVSGQRPIICNRINYWERAEWAGMWNDNFMYSQDNNSKLQYSWNEYIKMVARLLMS